MNAKTYLSQLKSYKADLRRASLRLQELEETMTAVSGVRYDKVNVQRSPGNAMEDNLIRYLEAKEKVEKQIVEYNEKYCKISGEIDGIENTLYREVLKQYFLEDRTCKQIADRMGYAETYIKNCFWRGVKAFQKKYL